MNFSKHLTLNKHRQLFFSKLFPQNNKIFPQDISPTITKASNEALVMTVLHNWWNFRDGEQDAEWTGQAKLIREEESSICLSTADDMALLIAAPLAAV